LKPLYLLDTNTVSYIVSGRSQKARRKLEANLEDSAISVITEAELRFGLARRPAAVKLRKAVETLLTVVPILPWDSEAAKAYATMRARMAAAGRILSALDMLIAAQAASVDAVLVSNDKAFQHAEGLHTSINWATDI
jgi:tRNA(fMet)-specific endonuclease VapC